MSEGGAERQGDTESEAGSRLRAVSTEPDAGLEPTNREPKLDAQPTEPAGAPITLIMLTMFRCTIQWQYVHSLFCNCPLHPSSRLFRHSKLCVCPLDPNPPTPIPLPRPGTHCSSHPSESGCSRSVMSGVLQYRCFRDWLISRSTVASRSVPVSLDLTHFSPRGVAQLCLL